MFFFWGLMRRRDALPELLGGDDNSTARETSVLRIRANGEQVPAPASKVERRVSTDGSGQQDSA
jgi:hypothetical protein